MNRRTVLFAAAAAVALLLAGYSAYWWMMADRLEAGLDAWIAAEKQAGLVIDADWTSIGGHPVPFTPTLPPPHVHRSLAGPPTRRPGRGVGTPPLAVQLGAPV